MGALGMLWLKGFVIGLLMAIPVGPVVLLCVNRTLNKGKRSGFASGLGVSSAEFVYSVLAGLGVKYVLDFIVTHRVFFEIIGGIVLFSLGLITFFTEPKERSKAKTNKFLIGDYFSTFVLTLAHPLLFVSFVAVFASLTAITGPLDRQGVLYVSWGIFSGSVFWWTVLIVNFGFFFKKFFQQRLRAMNRFFGTLIMALSVAVLIYLRFCKVGI